MKSKRHIVQSIRSKERGFSLVTVTLFGLIATMWLTATITSLIPAYQKAAQQKYLGLANSAAEAAADWAIDSLNTQATTGNPSPLDSAGATPKITPVPANVLNNPLVSATVTVNNIAPPLGSYLYDPQTVPTSGSNQFSLVRSNGWRVVECVATLSGGTATQRVRVILKPDYVLNPFKTPPVNPANPAFNYSLYGSSSVNMGSNSATDGYNSSGQYPLTRITASTDNTKGLGGDVGSFSKVALSSNVTVGGNVDVTIQPAGSPTRAATGQDATTVVNRYMTLNGSQDGTFFPVGSSNANVLGLSNVSAGFSDDLSSNVRSSSILVQQGNPQGQIAPAPPAPPSFQDSASGSSAPTPPINLGALTLSATTSGTRTLNTTIVVSPSAPAPSPTYSIVQGTTNFIQPGNYTASSINMGDGGQIIVASNLGAQPFRLFVDGSSNGANAINITGTGSSNGIRNSGTPSNVQIYYNGAKNVNINNQRGLSAVVYAPNATINLQPSLSSQVPYFGSFVGNVVNTKNAFVHFDRSLTTGSYANSLGSALANTVRNPSSSGMSQRKYLTVSWQEF
jgi:hypothetical protein